MLFKTLKALINNGRTNGLNLKIDVFYATGKLTDNEYKELTDMLGVE